MEAANKINAAKAILTTDVFIVFIVRFLAWSEIAPIKTMYFLDLRHPRGQRPVLSPLIPLLNFYFVLWNFISSRLFCLLFCDYKTNHNFVDISVN